MAARQILLILGIVLLIRLPFLTQPIQGDDPYYLFGAQHALIDPAHPSHARYIFQGEVVDMRGHPHPPLDAWILAGLLAIFGDVYEVPFHAAYMLFSLIAAIGMWFLAKRFSDWPLGATLLFLSVPAFVVNGNSLEADLPFLAFWMAGIALFVAGRWAFAAIALALAAMTAYQAIVATPILMVYCWLHARRSKAAWAVALTPVMAVAVYQAYERATSGALPATVLAGYFSTLWIAADCEQAEERGGSDCPCRMAGLPRAVRVCLSVRWTVAVVFAAVGLLHRSEPAVLGFVWRRRDGYRLVRDAEARFPHGLGRDLLRRRSGHFFRGIGAISVADGGSDCDPWLEATPMGDSRVRGQPGDRALPRVRQLPALGRLPPNRLADSEGDRSRSASGSMANGDFDSTWNRRVPYRFRVRRRSRMETGSYRARWRFPFSITAPTASVLERDITATLPFRLIGLNSRSGYSTASAGFRPFDIATGPIDHVRVDAVLERKPVLSYLPMTAPEAQSQIVSGVYQLEGQWRWTSGRAMLLLKPPPAPAPVQLKIFIPDPAPARKITVAIDNNVIHEQTFPGPGAYTVETKPISGSAVTLSFDKTFSVPGDHRALGVILSEAGFARVSPTGDSR